MQGLSNTLVSWELFLKMQGYNQICFINGRITPPFFQGGDGVYIRNILQFLSQQGTPITCIGSAETYPLFKGAHDIKQQIIRHRFTIVSENEHSISYQINPHFLCTLFFRDEHLLQLGLKHISTLPENTLLMTQINYSHAVIAHNANTRRFPIIHFVHDTHSLNSLSLNLHSEISLIAYNSQFTQSYFQNNGFNFKQTTISLPSVPQLHRTSATPSGNILFVNPTKHKGTETVLKIIKELPQYQFIIQDNYDSSYHNQLSRFPNCTISKRQHSMYSIYRQTGISLVPSIFAEPFGMVAIESLSFGIPTIASNIGGLPESVGNAGILINEIHDVQQWITAIKTLKNNRTVYNNLQQKSLQFVRKFSVKNQVNHLFNELEKNLR